MQKVPNFESMAALAKKQAAGTRAMGRLRIGPDPVAVVTDTVIRITNSAIEHDLHLSLLTDPESTPEAHQVLIIVNGTKDQVAAFATEMAATSAR